MRKTVVLAIVLMAVIALILHLANSRHAPQSLDQPSPVQTTHQDPPRPSHPATSAVSPSEASPSDAPPPLELNLDDILRSNQPETIKADQLIQLAVQSQDEAQEDAVRHLVNLLDDEHYVSAQLLYTNAHTHPEVLSILMQDLLNRPESVKLPVALAIAQVDLHPQHEQAISLLRLHIDQDHGSNWLEWEQAVQSKLSGAEPTREP
jgi:hypothetical protein